MIRLGDFERIVFFTGAGLSAESGIPTYRGKGGIWSEYNYEDYACQRAFDRDPERVWDFHDKRREAVKRCEPSDGHRIIADVQRQKRGTWIVTQNIDGLHQRAGAMDVIELHGSLWRVRCASCGTIRDNAEVPIASRRCACGTYLRPDIVWFEDSLDMAGVEASSKTIGACDLLVSIGTSGVVFPAAELPRIAVERGATCVEINTEETAVSEWYEHRLRGGAAEVLQSLWDGE